MALSFKTDSRTRELAHECAERTLAIDGLVERDADYARRLQNIAMDLLAVHCNDGELDFDKLLSAPTDDFLHDVDGISQHLCRKTGLLQHCFVSRYAKGDKSQVSTECASAWGGNG